MVAQLVLILFKHPVVKDELDRFSANSANTLEQREVAKVMSAHFDEFKSISNEGGASDREVGPFASKHAGSDGITSSDTMAFEQYIARPGLESFIWDRRQDKLVECCLVGSTSSLSVNGLQEPIHLKPSKAKLKTEATD